MNTSFTRKIIEVSLTLASGSFSGEGGSGNTKTWRLGTDCEIVKPGLPQKNTAKIQIFNMPREDMEAAASLAFRPLQVEKNRVRVMAGDEENGLTLAFAGDVTVAVPNFAPAPDVAFVIDAIEGYVGSVTPANNVCRKGEVPVADMFAELAARMGYVFINRGVNVMLRNVAMRGGDMEKAQRLARAARCELLVDDGEMVIMPVGAMREDAVGNTPVWSENSGLLGYPSFSQQGISAQGLYEPMIQLGGPLRIDSIVPKATGLWKVTSLRHKLQANYPGAEAWWSSVEAVYPEGK
jgi:hypothetical protein